MCEQPRFGGLAGCGGLLGGASFARAPLLIFSGSGLAMGRAVANAVRMRMKRAEALIFLARVVEALRILD